MVDERYINMIVETNPLQDQSFGKEITLRRMESISSGGIVYLIEVDGEEWVATPDFKKALVIYNQMRVSPNIGAINRAYDDAIKKADANIEKKKRRKKNNPDEEQNQ